MINRQIKEAYDRIDPDAEAAKRIWSRINDESIEGFEQRGSEAEPNWNELSRPAGEGAPRKKASEAETGYEVRPESDGMPRPRREKHVKKTGFLDALPKPALIAVAAVILVLIIVLVISFAGKKDTENNKSPEISYSTPAGAQSEDLNAVLEYQGPDWAMSKISNVESAIKEWTDYKTAKTQAYYAEKLPYAGAFLDAAADYDGTEVEVNSDDTYTLIHWRYMEDWTNTSVSPITGLTSPGLVQVMDVDNTVTIDSVEYENYLAYTDALSTGGYGDYNYLYSVYDEEEAAKLEEIAAKYSLTIRKGEGENHGFGEATDAELLTLLSGSVGKGDIYTTVPQFDHFFSFSNGSFQSLANIALPDGRRMYTSICNTAYDEMVDGREAGAFTVEDSGALVKRSYTAADGTELTISQNATQAIICAYLDNSYVVVDMSINPWRESPGSNETSDTLAAKRESDLTVTDDIINYAADIIAYSNIGK